MLKILLKLLFYHQIIVGPDSFNPEEMTDRQMGELKETLDLSEKQEKQMRKLMIENFDNMKKMREKSSGDCEGMRKQMQTAREGQNAKINEILTEEQWAKYEVIEQERRQRRGQGSPQ